MLIKIVPKIQEINASQWNTLVKDGNPFLQHEFLDALEQQGCVGEEFGWHPCHIALYENDSAQARLLAAMPLYTKTNSYGEFVFDHAWADAYQRHGLNYFPKLVSAIPYTPAHGQRLLCLEGHEEKLFPILLDTAKHFAREQQYSGLHCLFPETSQQHWLNQQEDLLIRHDCQFHWHNQGYTCFEDFLEKLTAKKRKNIRQERKRVAQQGIKLRVLDGHTATETDWQHFSHFYKTTFDSKYGIPTLNFNFFKTIGKTIPDRIILVLADRTDSSENECIAGSLMFRSDNTLYGRHWGCTEHIDKLHFEACYYQGIEYCIKHGLQTFEPGAQGEHKIARGFIPTLTQSAHWLNDSPFQAAIEQHIQHEKEAVDDYMKSLSSPYQNTNKTSACE